MLGSFGTSLELRRWSFKIDSWPERTEISRARRELLTGLPGSNCRATENNPESELLHGVAGGVRQMKPFSWFGAGQDDSFRRVRRTANVSSTANGGMAPTAIGTRFGRASRRGLSDVCQPQSSRIRIWTQGRARRRVGKSGLGTRSRARGTTLMLESAGGEPLHRLNLPTHGDRKTAWR
jgi:hypothetical protein